jgi:hypothetical protein
MSKETRQVCYSFLELHHPKSGTNYSSIPREKVKLFTVIITLINSETII